METNKSGKRGGGGKKHSGQHGEARNEITRRNKARRSKRQAAWLAKRRSPEVVQRVEQARDERRAAGKAARDRKILSAFSAPSV